MLRCVDKLSINLSTRHFSFFFTFAFVFTATAFALPPRPWTSGSRRLSPPPGTSVPPPRPLDSYRDDTGSPISGTLYAKYSSAPPPRPQEPRNPDDVVNSTILAPAVWPLSSSRTELVVWRPSAPGPRPPARSNLELARTAPPSQRSTPRLALDSVSSLSPSPAHGRPRRESYTVRKVPVLLVLVVVVVVVVVEPAPTVCSSPPAPVPYS